MLDNTVTIDISRSIFVLYITLIIINNQTVVIFLAKLFIFIVFNIFISSCLNKLISLLVLSRRRPQENKVFIYLKN